MLERLLPTDATGPGAKEANVLRYIDWSLAGELAVFKGAVQRVRSRPSTPTRTAKFGGAFARLAATQQDAVLSDMESNMATGFTPGSSAAFEMIRTHAMQGMFGDPATAGTSASSAGSSSASPARV